MERDKLGAQRLGTGQSSGGLGKDLCLDFTLSIKQRLGTGWSSGGLAKDLCLDFTLSIKQALISGLYLLKAHTGEAKVKACHGSQLEDSTAGSCFLHPIKKRNSNSQCLACLWSQGNQGPRGITGPPKAGPQR